MDANLQALVQRVVNMDYNELVDLGQQAFSEAWKKLQGKFSQETLAGLVLGVVGLTIASDGYVSEKEVKLFNDCFGFGWSQAQVKETAENACNADFIKAVQSTLANIGDAKNDLFILSLVIASADETVKADELKVICGLFGF